MTMKLLFTACFCFLLLINGAPVECRRHREPERNKDVKKLFVFGDSFVDAGGRPRTSERTRISRSWFQPYGISDSAHSNRATGRFSNGLVQSDILAKILGSDESPLPYRIQTASRGIVDRTGVNFAIVGSGVFDGEGTTLRRQVDQMVTMVDDDMIEKGDLKDSVALISICAGHDYNQISKESSIYDMRSRTEQVANEIAGAVKRLQDVGVGKVLVNMAPPMGCSPWQSVASNYSSCQDHGNDLASMHNSALREKLDKSNDVFLLDLFSVFTTSDAPNKLVPCCHNKVDPDGYCGQVDGNGRAMYSLCDKPEDFFFWDYMHPTQAAWEDVMEQLVDGIQDFLGIESSW